MFQNICFSINTNKGPQKNCLKIFITYQTVLYKIIQSQMNNNDALFYKWKHILYEPKKRNLKDI